MKNYVPPRADDAVDQLMGRREYTNGGMRWPKTLLGLAIAQISLAAFVFATSLLFAPVSIAITSGSPSSAQGFAFGVLPFAILAALLTLIGAGMGIGALRCCRTSQRCLLIAHFVLAILTGLFGFIAMGKYVWVIVEYSVGGGYGYTAYYNGGYLYRSMMAMLWIGFLSTTALVITSMISTCFTCNAWCSGDCRQPLPRDSIICTPSNTGIGLVAVELGSNTPISAAKSGRVMYEKPAF